MNTTLYTVTVARPAHTPDGRARVDGRSVESVRNQIAILQMAIDIAGRFEEEA